MEELTTSAPRRHRVRTTIAAVGCSALMAIAGVGVLGAGTAVAGSPTTTEAPPPTCAQQTSPNARFVRWTYMQILYRCPDNDGLGYWVPKLDAGLSRTAFTDLIDMSDENLIANNIVGLYEGLLGRAPTNTEITTWLAKFRTEKGDADLIATLASSDEFWNHFSCTTTARSYSTDGAPPDTSKVQCWLELLYQQVLERSPDDAGMGYYLSLLGANPTAAQRYNVAYNYFERSEENARGWVVSAYFAAFNRPPDATGVEFWYHWVLNNNFKTFQMWTQLLGSAEGYSIAQGNLAFPQQSRAQGRLAGARG